MTRLTVAAAAWPVEQPDTARTLLDRYTKWVTGAAADILVFPEYGLMELAGLGDASLSGSRQTVSDRRAEVEAHLQDLAQSQGKTILAPSGPERVGEVFVNRARLFRPDAAPHVIDKAIMTRFEREVWDIRPGPLAPPSGKIGTLICYDSEFPLLARDLTEKGATLLLVPACTDTAQGHHRVRIAARARALEGQCITVHAPLLGRAAWCEAIDVNTGQAAVFGPPDTGFPADGILADSPRDRPGWVLAEIDLAQIAETRAHGAVANHADWPRQHR